MDVFDAIKFESTNYNDIRVHVLHTQKYKTNVIVVNIAQELKDLTVTQIALLPFLLKRGSHTYPTLQQIQERLDHLYGALLYVDVMKKGEKQIVQLSLEVVNEKYISEAFSLLQEAIDLISEIITNPHRVKDGFEEEYLNIEKKMLEKRINGVFDDKIQYAEYQTIKHMCENEPYRLLTYGKIEDLSKINNKDLYRYYQGWLEKSPIDIFIVGNIEKDLVLKEIENKFNIANRRMEVLADNIVDVEVKNEKIINEELNVSQGKLNIGLRTYTTILDDDYYKLLIYNGVLGGYAHSKLFVNVREKASLAYYAASRIDSHKGLMTIQSGIESQNYDRAVDIIKQQLKQMQDGKINTQELSLTKAVFSNQLKEMIDKPRQLVEFAYNSVLSNKKRSLEDVLKGIDQVTVEDITEIAKKVTIDTIYFLKGSKKEVK